MQSNGPLNTSKRSRLAWARVRCRWGKKEWRKIIFSDECYIYLGDKAGRVYITRRADKEWVEDCIVPTFKQSPIRVMVWGCIIAGRKGPLVVLEYPGGRGGGMTAARYQSQVLDGVLQKFYGQMKRKRKGVKTQQDGASSHRAKTTLKWFMDARIPLTDHLAQSPDVSAIEPCWHDLKDIIRKGTPPTTIDSLKKAVHDAWDSLPRETIDRHIYSMAARVCAVIAAYGGHTPY
ncbi:hypothetical protein NMY22_g19293 [Coprinellus aureogranulatus]|nr:hypothetical protein NMY22_g19293 [Coprinellus aureogranulatus]